MVKQKLSFIFFALLSAKSFGSPASIEFVSREVNRLKNDLQVENKLLTNLVSQLQINFKKLSIGNHYLGEIFQGGMVFYVDNTKQHGLLVSLSEIGDPIEWRNGEGGDRVTNAKGFGIGSGETNTRLIIAEQTIDEQDGDFAALRTLGFQILANGKTTCHPPEFSASMLCYGGWYLPSVYELGLLHNNLKSNELAHFLNEIYWSSTEYDTTQALAIDFTTGDTKVQDKSIPAHVRAIRNF